MTADAEALLLQCPDCGRATVHQVTTPVLHSPLIPVWHFLIEVTVASLIFIIIAAGAIGLEHLVHTWMSSTVDGFVKYALKAGEYSVLIADLTLLVLFLWKSARRAASKM